ncbi:MAG: CU044_2847 family protein [Acidimicrobiales bacterium]
MEVVERPGVATVGLDDVVSFEGVRDAISAIAGEVAAAWGKVRPSEATVEFGLNLTAKTGKLTGLLVEGGAEEEYPRRVSVRKCASLFFGAGVPRICVPPVGTNAR